MKYIVTGGAGFIGSHVVDHLINQGNEVKVIDNLSSGSELNINPKAEFAKHDLSDNELSLSDIIKGFDGVFHLAALPRIQPSFNQPMEHHKNNIDSILNLLMAMRDAGIPRIVISSSSSCYGNAESYPTDETEKISLENPYALQKYSAEQYGLIFGKFWGIQVISLRYFNVYGPRSFNPEDRFNSYSSVIGIFNYKHKNNEKIEVTGDGNQQRDFVHAFDVARANELAMNSKVDGDFFNVGFGKAYSINEVANIFSDQVEHIPERTGEAHITLADVAKIKKSLGWEPTISLEKALKEDLL